jgi:PAS domain S-box-containing protein
MTDKDRRSGHDAELREQAEAMLRKQGGPSSPVGEAPSPEELQETLHELRVHQIELEMQNEELRLAQEQLEASRARYFDLYDLAPVGYCTLSEQGLILEANLTAATLLGTSRSELVKQSISRFIFKDDSDTYYLHRKRLFAAGEPQECELRLVKPDGALSWAHLTGTAAQAEDGAPVCRVVLSDISARKQAEDELRDSTRLLESVVENIPLMIFLKEAHDLRFVIFNRAGEELLGYDRKGFLGKNNLDLFPPEQAAHFVAKDREVLTNGIPVDIPEEPIQTAKKGERLLHTRKVCIKGADGNTRYLLGISEDITERKQAEARMAEQLDELRRWHQATLGREGRVLELKKEVNELLVKAGQPPRYASVLEEEGEK